MSCDTYQKRIVDRPLDQTNILFQKDNLHTFVKEGMAFTFPNNYSIQNTGKGCSMMNCVTTILVQKGTDLKKRIIKRTN